MQMTLEADYAVRIIMCLAKTDGRTGAKEIAEETEVTQRFSLKILRKLVSAGLVKSFRGINGGYELAKNPSEISLCDVIETIEGNLVMSRCINPEFNCYHKSKNGGKCPMQRVYCELTQILHDKLSEVSFAELLENK